jgi:hypothetical protein
MRQTKPLLREAGWVPVKVSAASCRLRFIPCGPECIAKGCTARCCDAPTSEIGIKVYVSDLEAERLALRGAVVKDNFIQPRPGERLCPYKTAGHLCSLFRDPDRPLGCIVSPFMLNKTGTLVLRNRYKLLPCYSKEEGKPAYKVFHGSLLAVFGLVRTLKLAEHLDAGGDDLIVKMDEAMYDRLMGREHSLQGTAS